MSHFKLVSSTKASDIIPVNKYVSEKTGLTVIIANVEGPIVNGFFCLATEAHDDDGLPHTLEHLIFLGSKRYPYKGVLDLLANRCMAHGTNAWTDTDHTCYTIDTAGDAGMLTLLPIYMDHILQPTLTDEGFITEVHHIDGDGEDAGVVYCEMQGRENTADSRCDLKILRAMYPNHGYSAETGGIMENLRTSTNNIKVREFHKKFYRAENLTIILTGQIEAQDVFAALQTVEDDIIAKRMTEPQEEWVKPWQTLPPPPNYIQMTEQWPADTVDCGQVGFGWRGPLLCEPGALKELTGCAVLLRYLSDTAAAPLQRCLVEQEDALAGDVIYSLNENMATLIRIDLKNVPANKLEEARDKALLALQFLRDGDDPLDMVRLATLVRKQLRETIASLESDPHQAVAFRCIGDALYSQNEKDFISRMNPQETLLELLEENEDFWMLLLNKYFSCELVVLVGKPSTELQQNMAEDEKKRIEQQRAELGVHGLTQKAKALQEAMEYNERPPPAGMLSSVPVPSCENLKCHTIKTWSSDSEPCPYFDLKEIPMFARVHSLKTNLVYMTILMDTSEAAQSTRQWTPLLLDAMAECGVWRDGKLIPHEEVIATTEAITVSYSGGIGMGKSGNFAVGSFGQFLHVEVRCEPADYEEVVNHIYEVLYAPELTKERLLVFTQRLLNDVAQVRRNGNKMAFDVLRDSLYNKESNVHWTSVLRQQKFLKNILEQLTAGGDSAKAVLIQASEELKNITKRIWLHLATDFERYQLSTEPWKLFARHNLTTAPPKLTPDWELMSEGTGGCVVGVGGVESAFLVALSPGPRGAALVDIAPLLLALNYFTQLEGPMWRLIRGCGLSYSYGVRVMQTEARLMFTLYRATNVLAAYTKAKSIVEEFLENGEFDEDLFASAKSTALFEAIDKEKCPADVVALSLHDYLMQRPEDYNKQMVCALGAVRQSEARGAAQKWMPHLFVAGRTAIVCHPTKVQDVQAAFEKINVKLDAYKSMEESYFNE